MDYTPPVGGLAGAPYVDFNAATGEAGSIPPAKALEAGQREIVDTITQAGLTPDPADDTQLHASILQIIAANTTTSTPDLAHTDLGQGISLALDGTGNRSLKFIMTGATTVAPVSIPAAMLVAFVVHLHQDAVGGHAITLPLGTTWPYGEVPIWPTAALGDSKFMLATIDGGISWYASWMGASYA